MNRYHIKTQNKFIEFPYTSQGLTDAIKWRQDNSEYRFKRIISVWQTQPDEIEIGTEYYINSYPIQKVNKNS